MLTNTAPAPIKSAVLFIIFNRPDTTKKVFDEIRKARPKRLYVAADGARPGHPGEEERCNEARAIIKEIDWDCELKTVFRNTNLGCKHAVSSAIDWFFEHEEEGIILEDDCLPGHTFFNFCDILLEKYRHDTRVRHISGCNLQRGLKWGSASYYFSNLTHVWGWASWRRVWRDYDKDITKYSEHEITGQLQNIFDEPLLIESWLNIFKQLKAGKIDTWDYQLTFTNFFNHSLSIIPNTNLVQNIGFGEGATHTGTAMIFPANIPVVELNGITHPLYILPSKGADLNTLKYDFNYDERIKRQKRLGKRVKGWLKSFKTAE